MFALNPQDLSFETAEVGLVPPTANTPANTWVMWLLLPLALLEPKRSIPLALQVSVKLHPPLIVLPPKSLLVEPLSYIATSLLVNVLACTVAVVV